MDPKEAARQLAAIRRIMESATELTVLPGSAAIGGGVLCLAGSAVTYALLGSCDFSVLAGASAGRRAAVIALWVAVALAGVVLDVVMVGRNARRGGKNPWYRLGQLAVRIMGPAVVAALAVSLALAVRKQWDLIPGVWILLYGVAVWTTGMLSVHGPGPLGLVFIVCGVCALLVIPSYALLIVALSFGLSHILFGMYLLRRFGG